MRLAAAAAVAAGRLAGYDLLAFHRAPAFERAGDNPAPAVARRWSELLAWHPSLPAVLARPGQRRPELKKAEWTVKAAEVQVANGTAAADLPARLDSLKDQAPQLAPAIRKVEDAQEQVRHDERWKAVQAEALSLAAIDEPETPLADVDGVPPRVPRHAPPRRGAGTGPVAQDTSWPPGSPPLERQFVDDLVRSESLPNVRSPT